MTRKKRRWKTSVGRTRTSISNSDDSEAGGQEVRARAPRVPGPHQFYYADAKGDMKYWCVPESFRLPRGTTCKAGWRLWFCGSVCSWEGVDWKIKPYRELSEGDLKLKTSKSDLETWRSIYRLMETSITIPADFSDLDIDLRRRRCSKRITASSSPMIPRQ